jgi:hypothetical protein
LSVGILQIAKQFNLEVRLVGSYACLLLQGKDLSIPLPGKGFLKLLQEDPLLRKADTAFKPAFYTKNQLLMLPDSVWVVQAVGGGAGKVAGPLGEGRNKGRQQQQQQDQQRKAETGGQQDSQQQAQGEDEEVQPEMEEPVWLTALVQKLRASAEVQAAAVLGFNADNAAGPAGQGGGAVGGGGVDSLRIVSVKEQGAYCYVVTLATR